MTAGWQLPASQTTLASSASTARVTQYPTGSEAIALLELSFMVLGVLILLLATGYLLVRGVIWLYTLCGSGLWFLILLDAVGSAVATLGDWVRQAIFFCCLLPVRLYLAGRILKDSKQNLDPYCRDCPHNCGGKPGSSQTCVRCVSRWVKHQCTLQL